MRGSKRRVRTGNSALSRICPDSSQLRAGRPEGKTTSRRGSGLSISHAAKQSKEVIIEDARDASVMRSTGGKLSQLIASKT